jgi:hypothetical protein
LSKKIGDILIEKEILTPGLVDLGLDSQKFYGGRIGSMLVDLEALSERDLVEALCEQKGAKPAKAGQLKSVTKASLDLIPVKIAKRYQVIPMQRDNRRLAVAITDPNDLLALDELAFVTGCVIEPYLASERTILNALEKYYGIERKKADTVRFGGLRNAVQAARGRTESGPPAVVSQATKAGEKEAVADDAPPALKAEAAAARKFWADAASADPDAASGAPSGENAATAEVEGGTPAAVPTPKSAALELDDDDFATADILPDLADDETPAGAAEMGVADGNSLLLEDGAATVALDDTPRTLEEASRRLARVDIRDEIADVLLWCTDGLFQRSALFIFQKSRTIGWTGQGDDLDPKMVRKVVSPVEDVSIFTLVRDAPKHYQGILPENDANRAIVDAIGGNWPESVLVVPFGIKGRAIGCFYAEDSPAELEGVDLQLLFKLLQKAGLALEMLLLRTKIAVS